MGIDLTILVTRKYPPGHLYQPDIRTERLPTDPIFAPMPHTSLLDDVIRQSEDMAEATNRRWAAGFPARARSGQSLEGRGSLGVRVSPLHMPEEMRGRMVAVSI